MNEEYELSGNNVLSNISSKYWKDIWDEVQDRIIQKFNYDPKIIVLDRVRKGDTETQVIFEYKKRKVILDIALETRSFESVSKKSLFGSKSDIFFNGTYTLNVRREIYKNLPQKGNIFKFKLRFKLNSKSLNQKDLEKDQYSNFLSYASSLISMEILINLEENIINSLKPLLKELNRYSY